MCTWKLHKTNADKALYRIKIYKNCIEIHQNYASPKDVPKKSLLCIRFVTVAFRSEEDVSWRRGPLVTYVCPALDPPLGKYDRNTSRHVRGHEHCIPTKFHQNPSSSSVVTMCSPRYTCISAPPFFHLNKKSLNY